MLSFGHPGISKSENKIYGLHKTYLEISAFLITSFWEHCKGLSHVLYMEHQVFS